jgi:hypothetical protein
MEQQRDYGSDDDESGSFGGLPVQSGGGGPRTLELVFGIAVGGASLHSAMRQPEFEAELKQKLFEELQKISPLPLGLVSFQVHLGRDQVTMAVQADGPVAASMFWATINLSVAGHTVTLRKV